MKSSHLIVLSAAFALSFAPTLLRAKPPAKEASRSTPSPSAAPKANDETVEGDGTDSFVHWLMLQDGGSHSISVPFHQVISAETGSPVFPFDAKDPADTAFLHTLGTVMEHVLPQINRLDSPAHEAARLREPDEIVARIEEQIFKASDDMPGFLSSNKYSAKSSGRAYPGLRLETANGKVYYAAVTLYPTGKRTEATRAADCLRAFGYAPNHDGGFLGTSGCVLLIGIEYNGKMSDGIAFLNWDVVDVANVPVNVSVVYEANGYNFYDTSKVLLDGRKGTD